MPTNSPRRHGIIVNALRAQSRRRGRPPADPALSSTAYLLPFRGVSAVSSGSRNPGGVVRWGLVGRIRTVVDSAGPAANVSGEPRPLHGAYSVPGWVFLGGSAEAVGGS